MPKFLEFTCKVRKPRADIQLYFVILYSALKFSKNIPIPILFSIAQEVNREPSLRMERSDMFPVKVECPLKNCTWTWTKKATKSLVCLHMFKYLSDC